MPGFPSMPGMYAPANASAGVSPYQPQPSMSDATGNVGTSSGAPLTGATATTPAPGAAALPAPAAAGGYDVADESRKFNAAFQPGSELERAWQNERDVQAQRPAAGDPRYKPSIWRTLGSIGAGFATGYAGHGSPQAVQEGMKITEGGMAEPYNKALSVWQPRMDAAKTDVEAARRGYEMNRQGVMDRSVLEDRAAQARERDATADWRTRMEKKVDDAPPPTQNRQGADGQVHIFEWDPVKREFNIDRGLAPKQPKEDTAQQRYEDAIANGNQAEAAKWKQVMETEARTKRAGERTPGELTPAQIANEKIRLDREYRQELDRIQQLIKVGKKVPNPNDPSGLTTITQRWDATDPEIVQAKQRADDGYRRGLEAIGQKPGTGEDYGAQAKQWQQSAAPPERPKTVPPDAKWDAKTRTWTK
jgi:hypothetical protein